MSMTGRTATWPRIRDYFSKRSMMAGVSISACLAVMATLFTVLGAGDAVWIAFGSLMTALFCGMGILLYALGIASWRQDRSKCVSLPLSQEIAVLFLPRSRVAYVTLFVLGVLVVAFGGMYSWMILGLGHGAASWRGILSALISVLSVALGTVLLVASLVMRKRGRRLGTGLGINGVYLWRGVGCIVYPWESIWSVVALDSPGQLELSGEDQRVPAKNPEENWLSRVPRYRASIRRMTTLGYVVDPVAIYAAICYYHRHAEHRSELGTEEAVRRFRANNFPDINEEILQHGSVGPTQGRSG